MISISIDGGETVFSAPVPEGWAFTSRIVHSLEKTPVEDEYRVVSGQIWQWEERFQSNNAGLPTEVPSNGRFVSSPGWFIIRGEMWEFYFPGGKPREMYWFSMVRAIRFMKNTRPSFVHIFPALRNCRV